MDIFVSSCRCGENQLAESVTPGAPGSPVTFSYDAYGNTLILTGSSLVLRHEPKSRYATGVATRELQRDPIGYAGGMNLYEYVGGRASAVLDTTGLMAIPTAVPGLLASLLPGRGVFHVTVYRSAANIHNSDAGALG